MSERELTYGEAVREARGVLGSSGRQINPLSPRESERAGQRALAETERITLTCSKHAHAVPDTGAGRPGRLRVTAVLAPY